MKLVRPGMVRTRRGLVKLNRRAEAIISRNAWRAIGEPARVNLQMRALTGGAAIDKYMADRLAEACEQLRGIQKDIERFLDRPGTKQ